MKVFNQINIIFYLTSITDIEYLCYEDNLINRLEENLQTFEILSNEEKIQKIPLIFIFTKCELIKEKIKKKIDIKNLELFEFEKYMNNNDNKNFDLCNNFNYLDENNNNNNEIEEIKDFYNNKENINNNKNNYQDSNYKENINITFENILNFHIDLFLKKRKNYKEKIYFYYLNNITDLNEVNNLFNKILKDLFIIFELNNNNNKINNIINNIDNKKKELKKKELSNNNNNILNIFNNREELNKKEVEKVEEEEEYLIINKKNEKEFNFYIDEEKNFELENEDIINFIKYGFIKKKKINYFNINNNESLIEDYYNNNKININKNYFSLIDEINDDININNINNNNNNNNNNKNKEELKIDEKEEEEEIFYLNFEFIEQIYFSIKKNIENEKYLKSIINELKLQIIVNFYNNNKKQYFKLIIIIIINKNILIN
jgi:hypothetical protein